MQRLLRDIEKQIDRAMQADRYRLRRRMESIGRRQESGKPSDRDLAQLQADLEKSLARAQQRRAGVPQVTYDDELPLCLRRAEIARAISDHQVVVVCGETGSGKSTQLPKICLELGRGVTGLIGHTQPRRIAARSVAARIAEELSTPLGQQVGFKIRFADSTSPNTYIKLMTDGILLAETQGDRFFEQYDTIIIDEAHERSLNIDFLIGYLKRLLPKRRDLKVIITSATIDAARFSRHFRSNQGPAPVIEVSGRSYPIETFYRPIVADEEGEEKDWLDAVVDAIDEVARIDRGDMLVFMPTERDIHEAAKVLRGHAIPGDDSARKTQILPLYARLPGNEQQRIFQPHGHRRIVIATNVAESSLTVPGIRYVIDPGTARISRYSARSKTQRLPIEPISRASADQRQGRCGRVGPGVCVRLYSEEDYQNRDRFTPPEIQRSNLASVILQAKALRLGDIERFPFLDPPKTATIRDGFKTLYELGAVDDRQELTPLGRRLSQLPVDPRIGRMVLAADEEGCLNEVLIIASALEIRDPRDRPVEKSEAADEAHAKFTHDESDFLTYLNLWDFYHELRGKLSRNQLRKACRQNFLSYNRVREWTDVHRQLLQLVEQSGLRQHRRKDEYEPIHRAILAGLLANVANLSGTYDYTAAGGTKFHLWPGSAMFRKKPKWVMAAELVETGRRYLRCCARIKPEWIEPLGEHLVKRTYSEPHWDEAGGSAVALERVSLFGLIVVPRRQVQLGPIDPAMARELLIRDGLVGGRLRTRAAFFEHNGRLADEMERLEKKLRRHDFLRGEWARYEFYDQRLPEDVYDAARLEKWRKQAERDDPRLLFMTSADLVHEEDVDVDGAAFPDTIESGATELPLDYQFEPGSEEDGVHVVVPPEAVGQLDPERLGWLVPGLVEQKVVALIKSLPKSIRRNLVPAPDTAREVVGGLPFGQGCMLSAVAAALSRIAGQRILPEDFDTDRLPAELCMNVRVVDADGQALASGRNLEAVRQQLGSVVSENLAEIDDPQFNRDDLVTWDFDELPERVEVRRGGLTLTAYPMLVDRGDSVSLRLADSLERAARQTRRGLVRLFFLAARRDLRSQVSWFPDFEKMLLHAAPLQNFDLKAALAELLAHRAFPPEVDIVRSREQFEQSVAEGRERIGLAVQEVAGLMPRLLEGFHQAALAIEEATSPRFQYAIDDMRGQLDALTAPGFLTTTPWSWLQHYPRYFRAIGTRIDRLRSGGLDRDRAGCEEVQAHWNAYLEQVRRHEALGTDDPELVHFRWMLEEYRVSLFAQKLGTSIPVSLKRLSRQWAQVQQ